MASKAVKFKQKALSVVDNVHILSSHNPSNSCTITVKSSPPRTAAEMTKLSVRRGWMLKRNEQRAWQRRYCCLVPHTFLYYFESKDSEVPRGVIDLEAYTEIGLDQGTGAIVLGPGPGSPPGLRKYYFRPEELQLRSARAGSCRRVREPRTTFGEETSSSSSGGEEGSGAGGGGMLGEWLSGLHRERYKVIRDERDAYMNLQEEFMAQMQDTTSAMTEAESERGRILDGLRAEQAAARAATRDGLEQARALFREEGLPPEEATSLQLPALLARVRAVASERRSREEQLELELEGAITAAREAKGVEGESRGAVERLRAEVDALSARAVSAEARLQRAEEEAAQERRLRAASDSSLAICNSHLEAALVDAEQGQVNLGIMAGERRVALAKAAELTEQKRLLVREVKAVRGSLAEASAVNRRLARAYESLERSLRSSGSIHRSSQGHLPSASSAASAMDDTIPTGVSSSEAEPGVVSSVSPENDSPPSPGSSIGSPPGTEEWRETRSGSFVSRSVVSGGDGTRRTSAEDRGSTEVPKVSVGAGGQASAESGLQVRNLSTGDVDVVIPGEDTACIAGGGAGNSTLVRRMPMSTMATTTMVTTTTTTTGARERSSTEGESAGLKRQRSSLDTLGLKITQSFSSANWPWGSKSGSSEGGAGAGTGGASGPMGRVTPFPKGTAALVTVAARAGSGASTAEKKDSMMKVEALGSVAEKKGLGHTGAEGGAAGAVAKRHSIGAVGSGIGRYGLGTRSGSNSVVPSISLLDLEGDDAQDQDQRRGGVDERGEDNSGEKVKTIVADGPRLSPPSNVALDDDQPTNISVEVEERTPSDSESGSMNVLHRGSSGETFVAGAGEGEGSTVGPTAGAVAVAVLCRRCGGTVEGPLHSTCICVVPEVGAELAEPAGQASPAGLTKLRGVFRSFNGRVEVARQLLDTAIRQNVATNMGRPKERATASRSSDIAMTFAKAYGASDAGMQSSGVGVEVEVEVEVEDEDEDEDEVEVKPDCPTESENDEVSQAEGDATVDDGANIGEASDGESSILANDAAGMGAKEESMKEGESIRSTADDRDDGIRTATSENSGTVSLEDAHLTLNLVPAALPDGTTCTLCEDGGDPPAACTAGGAQIGREKQEAVAQPLASALTVSDNDGCALDEVAGDGGESSAASSDEGTQSGQEQQTGAVAQPVKLASAVSNDSSSVLVDEALDDSPVAAPDEGTQFGQEQQSEAVAQPVKPVPAPAMSDGGGCVLDDESVDDSPAVAPEEGTKRGQERQPEAVAQPMELALTISDGGSCILDDETMGDSLTASSEDRMQCGQEQQPDAVAQPLKPALAMGNDGDLVDNAVGDSIAAALEEGTQPGQEQQPETGAKALASALAIHDDDDCVLDDEAVGDSPVAVPDERTPFGQEQLPDAAAQPVKLASAMSDGGSHVLNDEGQDESPTSPVASSEEETQFGREQQLEAVAQPVSMASAMSDGGCCVIDNEAVDDSPVAAPEEGIQPEQGEPSEPVAQSSTFALAMSDGSDCVPDGEAGERVAMSPCDGGLDKGDERVTALRRHDGLGRQPEGGTTCDVAGGGREVVDTQTADASMQGSEGSNIETGSETTGKHDACLETHAAVSETSARGDDAAPDPRLNVTGGLESEHFPA